MLRVNVYVPCSGATRADAVQAAPSPVTDVLRAGHHRRETELERTTLIYDYEAIEHSLVPAFGHLPVRALERSDLKAQVLGRRTTK